MGEVFRDGEAFDRWLEGEGDFDDAMVRVITPPVPDAGAPPPAEATLELARQVGGGLVAGDPRTLRRTRLTLREITTLRFEGPAHQAPEHWSEGISPREVGSGIAFTIDAPGLLVVECGSVEVEALPDAHDTVPPWESESEVFLNLAGPLPSAAQVVEACRVHAGVEVAWRTHGGPRTPTDEVPARYDGWLVQRADRIAETEGGLLFVLSLEPGEDAPTWVKLTRFGARHDPVLWAALLVAFDALGVLRASCGNVDLDTAAFHALAARKRAEATSSPV